jgi:hypothetical protein
MENLTLLDLQIILSALEKMPDQNCVIIKKRIESLINDLKILIDIRTNKQNFKDKIYEKNRTN